MRSYAQRRAPQPAAPARREHRFIPSLATLPPELFWPTLQPRRRPHFPLALADHPAVMRFYLARAGIHHVVRHWLGGRPGTVLMPAYHHGVEVAAVRAAGAQVEFYRVDAHMRADMEDIARRLRRGRVCALHLTHFVGFAQPAEEAAELAHAQGAALLEDCALALLSADPGGRALGGFGDAAVFCLYKTLPVPHGGLLLAPGVPAPITARPPLHATLHHAAGLILAHLELRHASWGRPLRRLLRAAAHTTVDAVLEKVQTGTQELGARDLDLGASPLVDRLIARLDLDLVRVRRRRNFRRLAEALREVVTVIGDPLAPGACPLFLPVRVPAKRGVMQALRARGVEAIDFWSGGDPQCDLGRFPEVAALRREVLELPCHQSLDDDDIDFVARAVKAVLRHG